MVRISFARPSIDHEKRHAITSAKYVFVKRRPKCELHVSRLGPNHDRVGYSRIAPLPKDLLREESWHEVSASIVLGEGEEVFNKATEALKRWAHFQLDWAKVDPETPLFLNYAFCNSIKVLVPWMMNPLRVEYIDDVKVNVNGGRSFAYGMTTLHGHMLAGEERFRVYWNKHDDSVRYEIYSFSRPGNAVAWIGQPITHLLQSAFVKQSLQSMAKTVQQDSQL
eukprot:g765.t1